MRAMDAVTSAVRALSLLLVLGLLSCQSAPEGALGTELRQGDIGVTVTSYELRYLDLQADSGAVVTTQAPVLLLHLMVTNYSGAAHRYDTRDAATVGQQALTPLLFVDPGDDAEWRTQGNNIPLVSTGQYRFLGDPVTGLASIGAGETQHDILLFDTPPPGASALVLSLPPPIFGAGVETPGVIRIQYAAPEPVQPEVAVQGQPAAGDGFTFQLNDYLIDYFPNEDRSGFSRLPLLGLRYTITNNSAEPLRYVPPHRDTVGATAPVLSDGTRIFSRAQLDSGHEVAGQLRQPALIEPSSSLSDLALFERPDNTVNQLLLLFPGHNVGRSGQVRVRFSYTYNDPPLPPELVEAPPPPPEPVNPEEAPSEGP